LKEIKTQMSIYIFLLSLKLLGLLFQLSKTLRKEINNMETGFVFNARYQFKTRDEKVHVYVIFENGKMSSGFGVIDNPDVTIFYKDKETLAKIYSKSPEESLDYLLTNEMSYTGNISYLMKFSYLGGLLQPGKRKDNIADNPVIDIDKNEKKRKYKNEILGKKIDQVQELEDPYLKYLKNRRFSLKPAICSERARLLTEYHRENGFENDKAGNPLDPNLRQAGAIRHILANKKPLIHDRHLLAGSTTTKEAGVPVYPEFIGTLLWPELKTIGDRKLNPNDISKEDADILNYEVFPYWMKRNVREYCRDKYDNPVSQQLEERFVLYFMMKNNAISHTIPDFGKIIFEGMEKTRKLAQEKEKQSASKGAKNFYRSVYEVTGGVLEYASHLSQEALRTANSLDPDVPDQAKRIEELKEISRICAKVPAQPAETIYEGIMSIWISFVSFHTENANSALSIGRLDQLLQPLFIKDIEKAKSSEEKEKIIRKTILLVGSLFLKFNDHDPMVPDVGNKLFGGSSSDDTVTVGGVDRDGNNAVCDMTYIVLKAAEMLCFQDPNMNARYYQEVNSKEYLRRLCEVNINMAASPIIHNDQAMIESLVNQGIPVEDARDWAATGCVEPTIAGKHYGHTNCMLLNTVAPLEMALNNGKHPIIGEQIGPETGDPGKEFKTYKDFLAAYKTQLKFLAEKSVEINNYLGYAHQYIHPTPLLSAMMEGPMEKGKDIIHGGAVYNSSGVALVSITDVIDSLMAIKNLVYEKKELDFDTLISALKNDFEDNDVLWAKLKNSPKFGSDNEETREIAQDLMNFCYDTYQSHENYRGGKYLPGYWSISYHVGFGMLSGALPSGRKKGKAFTPGLTPAPGATDHLNHCINSVASLDHLKMPNNIAFNVKMGPQIGHSHEKTLDYFTSYLLGYFKQGGMQWQFNVISTDMMKDAMKNPEDYRWLLVRISGYNAYFTQLNKNMQIELIERTEHRMAGQTV
jgi:pyruvate formate-lyase/glycerol dehydratase family glycyl radical enzyme